MKKLNFNRKWRSITLIVGGMTCLSTLSFNCAPSLFQSASYSSMGSSLSPFSTFEKTNATISLLTGEQTFQTMLNVTGQTTTSTGAQMNEYNSRLTFLSTTDNLANITSSLILASTSLAGEVCNGLVAKEKALPAASRRFFTSMNFGATPANNAAADFMASVNMLAVSAWGRTMNQDEQQIFSDFFEEFKANLKTTNNAAQTDNLCISACSAVLSSFDALVY